MLVLFLQQALSDMSDEREYKRPNKQECPQQRAGDKAGQHSKMSVSLGRSNGLCGGGGRLAIATASAHGN